MEIQTDKKVRNMSVDEIARELGLRRDRVEKALKEKGPEIYDQHLDSDEAWEVPRKT